MATHPLALPLANAQPATTLGAKFSMPHAVASALVTGTGGAAAFDAASLVEPEIVALRERISVTSYTPIPEPPNDRPARVSLTLNDGRRFVRECLSAQGGPDRPLPDDVVWDKIAALASPAYPRIAATFDVLMRVEPHILTRGWSEIVDEICGESSAVAGPSRPSLETR